jgi:hypothetical protein
MTAGELPDEDWMLLVMAAGLNYHKTPPGTISRKVLSDARGRAGYFYTQSASCEPAPDSYRTAPSIRQWSSPA